MNGLNKVAAIIAKKSKPHGHFRNFNDIILLDLKSMTERKRSGLFDASVPDSLCETQYFQTIMQGSENDGN
jgi:hypothetical protein